MLAARLLRTALAAVYFTMVARALGVQGYGAFAGACAMVAILAPFASLGTGNLLIQAVSRSHDEFPVRWGNCLLVTLISGSFLTLAALAAARVALPRSIPLAVVLAIALAELLCARLLDVAAMAFQAFEQLRATAVFMFGLSLSRLGAATLLLLRSSHATALHWALLYLFSTLLPAAVALTVVGLRLGLPHLQVSARRGEFVQGLYFAVSLSAQSIYNDIDKTMLARFSGLGPAGIYSIAYRIIDAAFSPVNAVLAAAYARFFRYGATGLSRTTRFARRLLSRALLYSALCCTVLWIAAPWVASILGRSFGDCAPALRALCPLLVLRSLHCFSADALTGAGYQATRTSIQVLVAVFNIAANLIVLPRYSWRGAVWTSLASDGVMAVALWLALWTLSARENSKHLLPSEAIVEP